MILKYCLQNFFFNNCVLLISAYYDNIPVIKLFYRKNDALLELTTKNE